MSKHKRKEGAERRSFHTRRGIIAYSDVVQGKNLNDLAGSVDTEKLLREIRDQSPRFIRRRGKENW